MRNLSDETSAAIAQLMPEATLFLFSVLDASMPNVAEHGAAAGHALAATLHVVSRQHSALARLQPALQSAPLEAARRLADVLAASAAEASRPLVPAASLKSALEAFFDMQRVARTASYAMCQVPGRSSACTSDIDRQPSSTHVALWCRRLYIRSLLSGRCGGNSRVPSCGHS